MTGAEIDTLVALVEQGPLWDGDVPSKVGRDDLILSGFAVRIVMAGEDGYTAATYAGRDAYKRHFGTALGGEANARLIAAAPDLLAVCQELEQSASYWSEYDVPLGIVDRIKSAIAKATGGAA